MTDDTKAFYFTLIIIGLMGVIMFVGMVITNMVVRW